MYTIFIALHKNILTLDERGIMKIGDDEYYRGLKPAIPQNNKKQAVFCLIGFAFTQNILECLGVPLLMNMIRIP